MAKSLSPTSKMSVKRFKQMQNKIASAQKKAVKIKAFADEKVQHLVRSVEVGSAGMAAGVIRGLRKQKNEGPLKVFNVPIEVLAAGVLHGAALAGVGGVMKNHLHSFGDGMLAVALFDVGSEIAEKGPKEYAKTLTSGDGLESFDQLDGQRLTDEELEELAR